LRILAPLAIVLVAIACLVAINGQGGDTGPGTEPAGSTAGDKSGESQAPVKVVKRSTYTVKAGDSFSAIAEQQGVDIEVLQQLNPEIDPRALQPGQKLKLKQ
jgi:LysM repeat protein